MTGSILALARALVRIPSQGGIDDPAPVLAAMKDWLGQRGVPARYLVDAGRPVALHTEVASGPAPLYCLNACLDTAPVGDPATWSVRPFGADVVDGWLTGRGSADSKVGTAVFAHLAADLAREPDQLEGAVGFLFDADEHTGRFGGIKRYLATRPHVNGVMIGYPGNSSLVAEPGDSGGHACARTGPANTPDPARPAPTTPSSRRLPSSRRDARAACLGSRRRLRLRPEAHGDGDPGW